MAPVGSATVARDQKTQEVEPREPERVDRRRLSNPARVVVILVVLAAVISFIVQNNQSVKVHFWFVTGHVRLLSVAVVSLIVGAVAEAVVRRVIRLRIRATREQFRLGSHSR